MNRLVRLFVNKFRGYQSLSKLVKRGLKIGKNHIIMSGSIIDPSHCWHISIGDDFWLGHNSQVIAHDASLKTYLGFTKIRNIEIGDRVFIGAGSIVLPGVKIGSDVIIGAGSVISKDIPSNSVAAGNPARVICSLDDYLKKEALDMKMENTFDEEFTLRNKNFSQEHALKMIEACRKYRKAYVK